MSAGDAPPSIEAVMELANAGFEGGVPWTVTALSDRGATLEMVTDARHRRPGGTVSGPTLMMMADSAAYVAVLGNVGLEPLAVTTNLSITFLRRPTIGALIARAEVLKVGRTQAVIDVRLHGVDDERLWAQAVVTYSLVLT